MAKYNLICMAFDGDYVTEKTGFDSVDSAWKRSNDMGSRWYFYPFHFVTSESGMTVIDAGHGLESFKGKRVNTVVKNFKKVSEFPDLANADVDLFVLALQGFCIGNKNFKLEHPF